VNANGGNLPLFTYIKTQLDNTIQSPFYGKIK